jgi:RNA polymerase sigma-70 factor (ECF subfamily)
MNKPPSTPDPDALLAHSGWVRALARNLVVDPSAADDVEQQAWLTAMERPPSHGGNLRSWWGAVVRTAATKRWRDVARRQEVAGSSSLEDLESGVANPDAMAERLDTFGRLADAVAKLPEPYRSVIYLRYVEELSVREVAKQQRVQLATAQSHIHRGLEKLRVMLAENLGSQWRHRCLVFALPMQAAPWFTLGPAAILAMKTKTTLGVAAGLLALISLSVWQPWDYPEPEHQQTTADGLSSELIAEDDSADIALPEPEVEQANTTIIRTEQTSIAAADGEKSFHVLVLDGQSLEPAPGATVHLMDYALRNEEQDRILRKERPDNLTAVQRFGVEYQADEHGVATIPLPKGRYQLAAASSGERFAYHWSFEGPEEGESVELLLLPEAKLSVEVMDRAGHPVAGVKVGFEATRIDYAGFPAREVTTDENGRGIFRHLETEIAEHPERLCTFALLVPGATPQAFELRADTIAGSELKFTMPATGSVVVKAQKADGTPFGNGIPIILQVADDNARKTADGTAGHDIEDGFDPRLRYGVSTAYVRDGVATFTQVAVGAELAAATYDRGSMGYAVAIGNGPSSANEEAHMDLILQDRLKGVTLMLTGPNGAPLAAQSMSYTVSGVDENGSLFGYGSELSVEEGGVATIKLREQAENARSLFLTTNNGAGARFRKGEPQLSLGMLLMKDLSLDEGNQTWEVAHAAELLVAGQIVDQTGVPFANCPLVLSVTQQGDPTKVRLMDYWKVVTDEEGRFEIYAPQVVEGMAYKLSHRVEDHFIMRETPAIEFTPGQKNGVFTVARINRFAGRVVVDDVKDLLDMELRLVEGNPGEAGSIFYSLDLDPRNGRFQSRPISDKQYTLVARVRGTFQEIARLSQLHTLASFDGEDLLIPDWDLRGKLFRHSLHVTSSSGTSPSEITLRMSHDSDDLQFFASADYEFLSLQAVQPITVGAVGSRDQLVTISGELNVQLQDGFNVQVDFDTPLPSADGLQWRATLVEVRRPGQKGGISWDNLKWQKVSGKQAKFKAQASGNWAMLLRAAPTEGFDDKGFVGMYGNQDNVISVDVSDDDAQINASLNAQELERVMAEVLASEE